MSRKGFSPSMPIKNDASEMYCFPAVSQALPNRGSKSERWCWGGNLETEPVLSVACGCSCTPSKKNPKKQKQPLSFPPSWHLQPDNRFEFLLQGEEGKEGRDGRPGPPGEPVRDSGFLSLTRQSSCFRNDRSVSRASRTQAQ